ncbi:hypothetical protein [Winogradskyella haliclonae]|uniref:VWFA domain-containing protein n=1 Tax=Winogradskyella haliclonae TaxID=2048558 RepID=A0ABQ2BZN5_9FLAO|nr:hypothetical protein [Winogradskyella haliclonae]GGI56973.1 hypothetical protein GCM10011444_12820 [Winogradskyella haliclonae]
MNIQKYFTLSILMSACIYFMSCEKDVKSSTIEGSKKEVVNQTSKCPNYILKEKDNNLNISVLLDLSDRIKNPKTKLKDSAYLSSLAYAFVNHVKRKKVILLEDRIQLFFNPEPTDERINSIAEKLKVRFSKGTSRSQLEETLKLYSEYPSQLYNLAQEDAKIAGGYPGSDLWRFFKDNINDYCIDECHRNIVVILTDGYMYYDKTVMKEDNKTSYLTPRSLNALKLNTSNWENDFKTRQLGFIPANKNLNDLEVLVIGITSQNDNNPYAKDIIELYWSDWLKSMNVKNFKIKNADLPSSIEKVISDFINN